MSGLIRTAATAAREGLFVAYVTDDGRRRSVLDDLEAAVPTEETHRVTRTYGGEEVVLVGGGRVALTTPDQSHRLAGADIFVWDTAEAH